MLNKISALLGCLMLSACANMANGPTQKLTLTTSQNQSVSTTECTLTNDEGQWTTDLFHQVEIERDGDALLIECKNERQAGLLSVEPDFQGEHLLNDLLLDLCVISCFIDGASSAWYVYPSYLTIDMQAID